MCVSDAHLSRERFGRGTGWGVAQVGAWHRLGRGTPH